MNRPIRILHVETGMHLYGGALQVLYLLQGLSKSEEVQNLLVSPPGSDIGRAAAGYVAGYFPVPMKGDLDLLFIPRLMSLINREKPRIIHLHSRRGADVLGGLAGKFTGIKCLLTRRVDNPESRHWAAFKYRLFDRIATISQGITDVLVAEGVPMEKITCVPSAVDTRSYTPGCDRKWFLREFCLEENTRTCGIIAQFIERKGHRFLLEAVPWILRKEPDTRFLLFGKGPAEERLRGMCRDLGIVGKVTFAGFREDLDRIIGCLDLLIHPALMEGLGVSLLQAAAAGVPIVATRVGGIPEIVTDGVNGYLIPEGDSKAIAEASVLILSDRHVATRMGAEGTRIARERFSINAMLDSYLSIYRSLLRE